MTTRTKIERADIATAEATKPLRKHPGVSALGRISELADQPPLIASCAATFAWGLLTRNARLARAGGRMLAAELLATKMKGAVKDRVNRTRPRAAESGTKYKAEAGDDRASAMNSFPSGHTAGAVGVARAFTREYPEHWGKAYAAAVTAAIVQVPRGKHYPTDVAVGAAIGVFAEEAVNQAEYLLTRAIEQLFDGRSPAVA